MMTSQVILDEDEYQSMIAELNEKEARLKEKDAEIERLQGVREEVVRLRGVDEKWKKKMQEIHERMVNEVKLLCLKGEDWNLGDVLQRAEMALLEKETVSVKGKGKEGMR